MMTGHGNLPRGLDLVSHQGLNKGTSFTDAERAALGLHSIFREEQSVRAFEAAR
jgi:hypothetical protein